MVPFSTSENDCSELRVEYLLKLDNIWLRGDLKKDLFDVSWIENVSSKIQKQFYSTCFQ